MALMDAAPDEKMSVEQAVMQRKLGPNNERPAWVRRSTRSAILEAARALIAREGFERTTLARVAEEAGFAAPTVYAYFVNKTDLVTSIVADDLSSFARAIKQGFPFSVDTSSDAEDRDDGETMAVATDAQAAPANSGVSDDETGASGTLQGESVEGPGEAIDAAFESGHSPDACADPSEDEHAGVSESRGVATIDAECEPTEPSPEACAQPFGGEHASLAEPASVEAACEPTDPTQEHAVEAATEVCDFAEADIDASSHESEGEPVDDHVEPATAPAKCHAEESVVDHTGSELEAEVDSPVPVMPSGWDASGVIAALEARIVQLEARRVDPWLERRLREFERMITPLEERISAVERTSVATAGPVESGMHSLGARIEALEKKLADELENAARSVEQRFEAGEARHHAVWSELRTLTLDTAGRIEALERDREVRAMASALPVMEIPPPSDDNIDPPESPVPEHSDAADATYLAAARRAALAAHSLAQADEKGGVAGMARYFAGRSRGESRRSKLLLGVCIGLGVAISGAGVALKQGWPASATAETTQPLTTSVAHSERHRSSAASEAAAARAKLEAGLAYLAHQRSKGDELRGAQAIESAAFAGQPVAEYWLGILFEHGRGMAADASQALRWYQASALQGNVKAMDKLAVFYAEGWGTTRDYGEAARWFLRAAQEGFVDAEYNMGVLYERGLGVTQSLLDAYKWYALAAAQGDKESAARIEVLSSQMSDDDLASARQSASDFRAEPRNEDANATPSAPTQTAKASD